MSRKRWFWVSLLAIVLAALIAGGWAARDQVAYAHIATGYAAKQLCSCVFVSGRDFEACVNDYPPDARDNIKVAMQDDIVNASVLFGAIRSEARFEGEEYGCRIVE